MDPQARAESRGDPDLYGRKSEIHTLRDFVERLHAGPSALLLYGEVGLGKSTLLAAAVSLAVAQGIRVLSAGADAPEATLPFATLFDLVDPILDAAADALSPTQHETLRVAVSREPPGTAEFGLLAVGAAFLALVRRLASASPVLIAIDDAQWVDEATSRTLRFVTRRLRDEPVGVIATARSAGVTSRIDVPWLATPGRILENLPIGPLPQDAIIELLRAGPGPALSARQMRQVVESAAGNPFFALELRRTVARDSLRPGEPLPQVPDSLRAVLHGHLAAFSPAVREALSTVAALAQPRAGLVDRAVGGDAAAVLEPAYADGVLKVDGDSVRFSHPLLRATAYDWGTTTERAARHRRLAGIVDDPVERARHLAVSAAGVDLEAARQIAAGAETAHRRGAPADAADLFAAAASHLRPHHPLRVGLLRHAADCLVACGRSEEARALLEDLIATTVPGHERAALLLALAGILYRQDDAASSVALLEQGLGESAGDTGLAAELEQQLALAITSAGDLPAADGHARRAMQLALASRDENALAGPLAFVTILDFLRGRGFDAARMARATDLESRTTPRLLVEWRPWTIEALVLAWIGRFEESRARLAQLQRQAQASGDDNALSYLLYVRCQVELASGRWDDARTLVGTARAQAEETAGLVNALLQSAIARVDAFTGDLDAATRTASSALATAVAHNYGPAIQENAAVLGFVELSRDRPDRAVEALGPMLPFLSAADVRDPGVLTFVPDLVEALIELGRLTDAEAALHPYEQLAAELQRASALPQAARCRALLAIARGDTATASACARRAVDLDENVHMPFERGRALLVLGTVHRRRREKRMAAEALDGAVAIFEQLGAPVWAERARRERSRIGLRPASPALLSGTELQVAELAARGLTTREIAAAAFLSPKGAEKALARVYRKLAVASRAELGARMATGAPWTAPTVVEGKRVQIMAGAGTPGTGRAGLR